MKYRNWETVSSYIADNLYARICKGEFTEGSKLPSEKALCEEYNAGRSSVREALRILQARNTIIIERGKGSFVLSADKKVKLVGEWYKSKTEQFTDLIALRKALECMSIKKAVHMISEEEIEKLEEINERFIMLNKDSDYNGLLKCDEAFHYQIVECLKFELFERLYREMAEAYAEYRIKGFILTNFTDKAAEDHKQLIKALRERDEAQAEELMKRHVESALIHIKKILDIMEGD